MSQPFDFSVACRGGATPFDLSVMKGTPAVNDAEAVIPWGGQKMIFAPGELVLLKTEDGKDGEKIYRFRVTPIENDEEPRQ